MNRCQDCDEGCGGAKVCAACKVRRKEEAREQGERRTRQARLTNSLGHLAPRPLPPDMRELVDAHPHWQADAACAGLPSDMFFPGRGQPVGPAKAICAGCPSRLACAASSLGEKVPGVRGGLSEKEQRRWRSARRRGAIGPGQVPAATGVAPEDAEIARAALAAARAFSGLRERHQAAAS